MSADSRAGIRHPEVRGERVDLQLRLVARDDFGLAFRLAQFGLVVDHFADAGKNRAFDPRLLRPQLCAHQRLAAVEIGFVHIDAQDRARRRGVGGKLGQGVLRAKVLASVTACRGWVMLRTRRCEIRYAVSSTSVSGRSPPAAVSVCHLPSGVSYSIASVRPGTRCSVAARFAAASAAAWVAKASENTPLTV